MTILVIRRIIEVNHGYYIEFELFNGFLQICLIKKFTTIVLSY